MSALLRWLAGAVQSSDGTTPSSTRICGTLVVLAFVVGMFVRLPVGTLTVAAGLVATLFGVRDGGPLDAYLASRGQNAPVAGVAP